MNVRCAGALQPFLHTRSPALRFSKQGLRDRHYQSGLLSQQARPFSSSNTLLLEPDHYKILDVHPTCTAKDLKKQFYALSRKHHPDANPSDPEAGKRFSEISHSYSVLANPEKRRRHDRDHRGVQPDNPYSGSGGARPRGSYAGSRPASGLSKRRGSFKGPPPSFYQQGGKRAESAYGPGEYQHSNKQPNANAGTTGGGQNDFTSSEYSNGSNGDFNMDFTQRAQAEEDSRRTTRRQEALRRAELEMEDAGSFWVRFAVVSAMLGGTIFLSTIFTNGGITAGGLTDSEGRKRSKATS